MDAPILPPAAPVQDPGTGSQRAPGYDVFISHSSKDKAAADAVCHALEARNIRCWIAPRDIRPGMNWGEAILTGLSGARIMALLLSNNANTSPQIEREVERAVHHNLIVIPVRLEDVAPGASLEYFLSTSHWLDAFHGPLNSHLERLVDTVQSILTGQPTSSRAAAATVPAANTAVATRASGSSQTGWIIAAVASVALVAGAAAWWFMGRPASQKQVPAKQNTFVGTTQTAPTSEEGTTSDAASETPDAEEETPAPSPTKE